MSAYSTNTTARRQCPTCNGTGVNPVATWLLCPKCNGEKRVPVTPQKQIGRPY